MIIAGVFLVALAITSIVARHALFATVPALGAAGILLLVIGVLLLITELMENWLTKGQAALVDGLQAG